MTHLKLNREAITHTMAPAKISSGQWTQAITLEIFMRTASTKNMYQSFLYPAKNNPARKLNDTVA